MHRTSNMGATELTVKFRFLQRCCWRFKFPCTSAVQICTHLPSFRRSLLLPSSNLDYWTLQMQEAASGLNLRQMLNSRHCLVSQDTWITRLVVSSSKNFGLLGANLPVSF